MFSFFTINAQTSANIKSNSNQKDVTTFSFVENYHTLRHDFEPWKQTTFNMHGNFWQNNGHFCKLDTLTTSDLKIYESKLEIFENSYLRIGYGALEISEVTEHDYIEALINSARYTPDYLLEFANNQKDMVVWSSGPHLRVNDFVISIYTNKTNKIVDKIITTHHDELYGDITTTYIYSEYHVFNGQNYPSKIRIEKINGKIIDEVSITAVSIQKQDAPLVQKPENFAFIVEDAKAVSVAVTQYSDYVYFIDLKHTDDRVLVVEFTDYLLVAEAPINSENGELIISEIRKSISNKPIKYFVFGHHHPHYLGGMRAFIHKEATVLCRESNREYIEFIANAPHYMKRDSLYMESKVLKTISINDSLVIGERGQMVIYFIGEKSAHTNDYLIYYFPELKLLFQDDLCWIPIEGDLKKAGSRQTGLYQSIVDLQIEVDTIVQSWPVESKKVKTIFSFDELQKSIEVED